jgi:hypothetical protein
VRAGDIDRPRRLPAKVKKNNNASASFDTSFMKITTSLLLGISLLAIGDLVAQDSKSTATTDPGWPRQRANEQGSLVYYQPQVDAWKEFKQLDFRMAFTLTPKGGKEIVGVLTLQAQTNVNVDDHSVVLTDFKITDAHFPSLDQEEAGKMGQLVRSFLPPGHTVTMSLDRLVATVEKSQAPPATVNVQNDPPKIFVSQTPAILLQVDGEPKRADITGTELGFVVNSNFPLFFETGAAKDYYLYTGTQWLRSSSMEDGWAPAPKLPKDFSKVANDPQWAQMKKPILTPSAKGKPPTIFYSNKPAEVILFQGQPAYSSIPGTQLSVATNTDADLFVYAPSQQFYYLVAGRWFKSADLQGPCTYATPELPVDFANIPETSPAARVLVSVPGTPEAQDAVLLAQIPTTAVIDPKAAEEAKVTYNGNPEFKPIEGTSLEYATNTSDKVIKMGDVYYLCLQGVWFMSPNAAGPWTTAKSVPKEIYTIPPSSPVYNVTYVTQSTTPEGTIQASYTAGYLGTFIAGAAVGAILANGTGYYYPPYYGYPVGGYPVYRPYPCTYGVGSYYNPYSGAYGAAHGVYGPYGGAAAGAAYNPYTGTYARGATAYGPNGSRTVAQAYNPYTGTYAATRQGSNAYSSWGQSVVSNGNKSAYTQHYSNANGTVGSIQGSNGGAAVGASTKYGNTAAGKTSSGDMYAAHDGNVYKNTGSGWQSYDNGNWNSVNKNAQQQKQSLQNSGANQGAAQQRAQSSQRSEQAARSRSSGSGDVDRDFQNRSRGASQSQRFDSFQRGGGGSGGRERGGGGRRRR